MARGEDMFINSKFKNPQSKVSTLGLYHFWEGVGNENLGIHESKAWAWAQAFMISIA
jgi:hypothetical protein